MDLQWRHTQFAKVLLALWLTVQEFAEPSRYVKLSCVSLGLLMCLQDKRQVLTAIKESWVWPHSGLLSSMVCS